MGQRPPISATDLDGFRRAARQRQSAWILDGMLVLGVLAWVVLRGFLESHPAEYGAFAALFVGAVIHRALDLVERRNA
jgi:hypothetical protein